MEEDKNGDNKGEENVVEMQALKEKEEEEEEEDVDDEAKVDIIVSKKKWGRKKKNTGKLRRGFVIC